MAIVSTLKDNDTDDILYPQTIIDAVFDTDGTGLREKLESKIPNSVIQSIVNETYSTTEQKGGRVWLPLIFLTKLA